MSVPTLTVPPSINHLPTEIITSIFKSLIALSHKPPPLNPVDSPPLLYQMKLERMEKYIYSPSLFPFNVAAVSKLWHDILALFPECWTLVVFNVAKDPAPLLDAFLWSENLENVEVVVFNSDDPRVVDKTRESSRVAAITHALRPHIQRCKSITFNVSYSTSLPPPTVFFLRKAPILEDLTLDCCIDDLDLKSDARATKINKNRYRLATSFPKLRQLSLTGFWFMYLAMHTRRHARVHPFEWLDPPILSRKFDFMISLTISHFKFLKYGHYTLPKFISYVSRVARFSSYYFRDFSLSYQFADQKPNLAYQFGGPHVHFQSVSKDFLTHLHTITDISAGNLSFEACEIPKFYQRYSASRLTLKNIIDNDEGRSLRHILEVWTGTELTIHSCPSFNDTILSWLAFETEYLLRTQFHEYLVSVADSGDLIKAFPAFRIRSLVINNCDNFSTHAIKELVRLRNEAHFTEIETRVIVDGFCSDSEDERSPLEDLQVTVSRGGPVLTDEDERWFEQDKALATVCWMVQEDQSTREIFRVPKL